MPHIGQDLALRNAVAAEPIRDDLAGLVLEAGQQAFEEAFGGRGIAALLHQDVEHDTVLIHRAPEIEELTVDLQKNLVHMPGVAWPRSTLAQLGREVRAEAEAPAPDALIADHDAPLGQDQLDVTQAQAKQVVEPDSMLDYRGWEAVAGVGGGLGRHPASLARLFRPGQSGQRDNALPVFDAT